MIRLIKGLKYFVMLVWIVSSVQARSLYVHLYPLTVFNGPQSTEEQVIYDALNLPIFYCPPRNPIACIQQHFHPKPKLVKNKPKKYNYLWLKKSKEKTFAMKGIQTKEKVIALTFDDGPYPIYTERILNVLKHFDVPATFFVLGKQAKRYPSLILKMQELGHEIGNHSYNHQNLAALSEKDLDYQIKQTQTILKDILNQDVSCFRPPYGEFNKSQISVAQSYMTHLIMWDVDVKDWNKETTVDSIVDDIKKYAKPGSIIVMHDTSIKSFRALKIVIPYLIKKGYSFKTVSQLINANAKSEHVQITQKMAVKP